MAAPARKAVSASPRRPAAARRAPLRKSVTASGLSPGAAMEKRCAAASSCRVAASSRPSEIEAARLRPQRAGHQQPVLEAGLAQQPAAVGDQRRRRRPLLAAGDGARQVAPHLGQAEHGGDRRRVRHQPAPSLRAAGSAG
jgi:hypothetical protein